MASLHKLPNGKHCLRWREGDKQLSRSYDTKRAALLDLERMETREAVAKPHSKGAILSLDEIIERWTQTKISSGHEPAHIKKAAERCRGLANRQGWTKTADVTAESVQAWKTTGAPRSGATFRAVLRWAGDVLEQPVHHRAQSLLRPTGAKKAPKRPLLTDAQLKTIQKRADAFGPSCGLLIHCLSTYGWRPITASRLLVKDVDPEARTVTTRVKGGDIVRHLLLPETILLLWFLMRGRGPDEPLFLDPRTGLGWALSDTGAIPQWFNSNIVDKKKDSFRIYDLKRKAITTMLQKGMRREQIVAFTGHRVLHQIDSYTVFNDETMTDALTALAGHKKEQKRTEIDLPPLRSGLFFTETSEN
jgi:hypothetical protein